MKNCELPPRGWECSRRPGHEGPCAAIPVVNVDNPDGERYSYPVTNKQAEQARIWQDAHDQENHIQPGKKHRYSGAIGGAYTWQFTGTSLGVITSLRCSCGDEINLTDWDNF